MRRSVIIDLSRRSNRGGNREELPRTGRDRRTNVIDNFASDRIVVVVKASEVREVPMISVAGTVKPFQLTTACIS